MNKKIVTQILNVLENLYPDAECELHFIDNYQLLIAVCLSAQTTDIKVNEVTKVLFNKYPDFSSLACAEIKDVENIIKKIGLYRNKTKNIIALSEKIIDVFSGEIPANFEKLVSLPGVGRKTANVVLANGFSIPRIAVDTHVFRLANKIGFVNEKNETNTEIALMNVIPENLWIKTHHRLILHGRRVCFARSPNCDYCAINNFCEFYLKK